MSKKTSKRAPKPHISKSPTPPSAELPRWVPIVAYALVTVILFRETLLTGVRLLGLDNLELGLFARDFYTTFISSFHAFPVWNPLMYGGLPFLDGMHGDIFYPPSLALFFMDARTMWGWKMALHIFMAGCFTYMWLRQIAVSRNASFIGGLIYMMSPLLVSMVFPGGDGKLFNYALAPLLFWLTERAVATPRVRTFAALSLGVAALVFTSQMQVAYFCIWGFTAYYFFRVAQTWRAERSGGTAVGRFGAFAVAGVLGVAAAAVQFVPPLQYLREWSHRSDKTEQAETGYAYSTTWSLHPEEVMSLVVPEFVGDNVQTETRTGATYWGRNVVKLNHEYASFIPLLLLPLLFRRRRDGRTWFFVGLSIFALLFALGANTPFFRLFYLIPGVTLFRAPSLIIFLFGLSMATLAALAIDRAIEWVRDADGERTVRKTLWIGVGVLGVLALLASAGLFTDVWRSTIGERLQPNKILAFDTNLPLLKVGFWVVFVIGALVAAAWEAFARGLVSVRGFIVLLALLVFVDLYRWDRPFIRGTVLMNQSDDPIRNTPDETVQFFKSRQQAGEVFRVVDLGTIAQLEGAPYPQNAFALHGIEQLAGHHGNELARYRQLIGGDRPISLLTSQLRLADITNTVYLTSPQQIEAPGLTEVFRGNRAVVYRKEGVLPRAYVVSNVEVVPEANAVERLLSPEFNARTTALLSEPLPAGVTVQPTTAQPVVNWLKRANNEQRIHVNADAPVLLVVLDNYYKAWKATVNGNDAPMLRANHTFRAIPVPAGPHEVVMRYDASYIAPWAYLSGITLLILMVLAFGLPLLERFRSREEI